MGKRKLDCLEKKGKKKKSHHTTKDECDADGKCEWIEFNLNRPQLKIISADVPREELRPKKRQHERVVYSTPAPKNPAWEHVAMDIINKQFVEYLSEAHKALENAKKLVSCGTLDEKFTTQNLRTLEKMHEEK